jgi:hypothetical protein
MREHDVSHMMVADLERARRELSASLALARPDAPSTVPAAIQLGAVESELSTRQGERASGVRLCSCGFASNGQIRFGAHLENNPGHQEMTNGVGVARSDMPCHWPACKITINGQDVCDEGRDCKG